MERRELLKMIGSLTGVAFIGGSGLLTGCSTADKKAVLDFSAANLDFLNEVGETILPATATPGAKAANVSKVMQAIVTDCYEEKNQLAFMQGISALNEECSKKYNHSFLEATPEQREALLKEIDQAAKTYQQSKEKEAADHYFTMMKQLTLLGYFTSEIGCKQARRYQPVPQRYDGCVPYTKGDKAIV